ncbi:hypothetical protein LX64_02674 [Chitinophaga skermanii]|uniref:Uncharacterized protein n=1 Tax=Chitinophaga skermanii TaxID=331697 RepID=A0A327QP82_9BACT|nr:hypothetical protein LX64_02674 [Chitinophaga skermanii]
MIFCIKLPGGLIKWCRVINFKESASGENPGNLKTPSCFLPSSKEPVRFNLYTDFIPLQKIVTNPNLSL